jgi:hypothetical protein
LGAVDWKNFSIGKSVIRIIITICIIVFANRVFITIFNDTRKKERNDLVSKEGDIENRFNE